MGPKPAMLQSVCESQVAFRSSAAKSISAPNRRSQKAVGHDPMVAKHPQVTSGSDRLDGHNQSSSICITSRDMKVHAVESRESIASVRVSVVRKADKAHSTGNYTSSASVDSKRRNDKRQRVVYYFGCCKHTTYSFD